MKPYTYFFIGFVIVAGFIYLVSPVLTPFVMGGFFAWLLNPLVKRLVQWHWPRFLAVIGVFCLLIFSVSGLLLLMVPRVVAEMARLMHLMPDFLRFVQRQIPAEFSAIVPKNFVSLKGTLSENGMQASSLIGLALKTAFHSGATLAVWLGNLILVPVVTLYLLYDWEQVLASINNILPKRYAPTILRLAKKCDAVLAAFFRGQLLVMLTLGVIYSVGLTALGLQVGVLIGVMIGLLAIIPYLGVILGVVTACIAAWVQSGYWHDLIPVLIFFGVVQVLDSALITPRLVGHRIGLHPVWVIFAVLAGGAIAGFVGVLVALPVAAMIRVLFDFFTGRVCVE